MRRRISHHLKCLLVLHNVLSPENNPNVKGPVVSLQLVRHLFMCGSLWLSMFRPGNQSELMFSRGLRFFPLLLFLCLNSHSDWFDSELISVGKPDQKETKTTKGQMTTSVLPHKTFRVATNSYSVFSHRRLIKSTNTYI